MGNDLAGLFVPYQIKISVGLFSYDLLLIVLSSNQLHIYVS
jgi:hypothetical protein